MALKWSREHVCSWSMKERLGKRQPRSQGLFPGEKALGSRLGKRVIKVLKNIWNCAIGKIIVNEFVQVRLIKKEVKFHDSLKQQKLKTFETFYSVPVSLGKDKTVAIKADRDVLRRVVVALESGRKAGGCGHSLNYNENFPLFHYR